MHIPRGIHLEAAVKGFARDIRDKYVLGRLLWDLGELCEDD